MKDKIFGVLQRVGRSFMLPIALLPVAGLLLGIGSSFTNETMLEAYGLTGVIHPGTIPYTVLDIMNQCGSVVFNNLALLFAMGVAIGMAKKEKEVAALSGAIAYLVMNTAICAMINASGGVEAMAANTTTSVLGITSLQMGVFGGIIVGLGVAALHNRFYKTQLPQVLSFFGGTRFVPIVCTAVYLLVGIAMFYVWPVVQHGIGLLGNLVISSGYAGTFIYGLIERALIPFGLHHVFYMPFWQTAVGGTAVIDGVTVQGAQNIFFAELASKTVTEFSVDATRFMAGKFPLMIFGLPGAALAMYRTARPQKRKVVFGLLLSAALTSMVTGITEPLEFTFLFVAPLMYAVHCVYAGLAYMLMHILNVCVGMTFSGGLIDLTLFGILQGNAKTHWIWVVIVGVGYFVLYYITFTLMIRLMDLKTPGREPDDEEPKLYTRSDMKENAGPGAAPAGDNVSATILRGLGGKANISDVDCCATRLRVTVVDSNKVSDGLLKQSGASGVVHKGNGIQVIYGPQVAVIKSNLVDFMETPAADKLEAAPDYAAAPAPAPAPAKAAPAKAAPATLGAHMAGTVVPMNEVQDEAFASCALGEGVAIEPSEGKLYAPADALVDNLFDTHHAVSLVTSTGAEILLHVGIDTVKLNGQYFTPHVQNGQKVKKGDLLISFDQQAIKAAGYLCTTPMIVCNTDDYAAVKVLTSGAVQPGQDLVHLE
ncbi:MAG TPA: glucose PTS transporter subunit IIA [Candidatus Faecalibacterium avium]|uniref:PTS transporter subunit IIABC n=1 Tax=Faecalibacterium sp. An58 TaxID=1965648 RepID=UPI000B392FCC|nr:PTS transporter subunit IIABC [Faecalibacterium sp. An58]OUN73305.1 PTS glucose transporter subunit IIA [Faecalibacterium sp. An58]HIV44096.1 glucose PTS transporter subunit IIA [Candidatus Faecalibacterium avium]